MYEFPDQLPDPANLYMPCAGFQSPFPAPVVPRLRVVTFPGLFRSVYGGSFFPICGVSFLTMSEMLHLQALFAARQFLTARCVQHGLVGVSMENPFLAASEGGPARMFSELSLLSATLGVVSSEILLGTRRAQAQQAFLEFGCDISAYAPWLQSSTGGVPDYHALVRQGQDVLVHLNDMISDYYVTQRRFEEARRESERADRMRQAMEPPERERGGGDF
jgi:hypothetical protein